MSVATTYAEALYQAAAQSGAIEAVSTELTEVRAALEPDGEVAKVLYNPKVDGATKKRALAGLAGTANPLTVNLLQVLVDRGRLEELPAIASAYAERVSQASGHIAVEVTTAIPLDDDLRAKVTQRIAEQTGRTPEIAEKVDPEIIGGLILRVGGVMTDASVRGRLNSLRRNINDAS